MTYSEFEYKICNDLFPMAVLFPHEYCGVRSLIVQNWNHSVIMITINREENNIRVSLPNKQLDFESYDKALYYMNHLVRKAVMGNSQ